MNMDTTSQLTVAPARLERVKAACEGWIRKLIDPSRRNNLLFFRDLKFGTFDVSNGPQEALAGLLAPACEAVPLEQFVSKEELPAAAAGISGGPTVSMSAARY